MQFTDENILTIVSILRPRQIGAEIVDEISDNFI